MNKPLLAILALLVILIVAGVSSYNALVASSQSVDAAWAQVQNVYQRRADLVPNLVQTVQGAADFEKSTVVQVTEARASVGKVQINQNQAPGDASQLEEFQKAQGQLGSALSRLLVVAENYPNLKATAGFRDLQAQLEGTENRISVERGRFNSAVQSYNTMIRSLPAVFFAGFLGYQQKPYFKAESGAENAPAVKFNFGGSANPATSGPAGR